MAKKKKKKANGKINVLVYEDVKINSNYLDEYINSFVEAGISKETAETILDKYTK